MLALLLAIATGAPVPEIRVGDAAARHRVSVVGLDPATLRSLAGAGGARLAEVLAVFVGEPDPDRPAVLGAWSVDEEGLHFQPRFPFVDGVRYTARFEPGGGAPLVWTFEVAPPTGEPPRVLAVFPSSSLPENALRVYVHFSRRMDVRDTQNHVRLLDESGSAIDLAFVEIPNGLWDPGDARLTLLFHPGRVKRGVAPGESLGPVLRAGHEYRLVIDGAMADAAGRPLGALFEHRLVVGPADRACPLVDGLRVHPPEDAQGALVLELPEALDEALLQRLVWVEDGDGRMLPGRIEVGGEETRWTFRPDRPWAAGEHAVLVHRALEDRAGNRFDRPFDREAAAAPPEVGPPIRLTFRVGGR
jgi:hypothetical protein